MLDLQGLKDWGYTSGILGAECALGWEGLCSYPSESFPIMLNTYPRRLDLKPCAIHPMVTEPTPDELIHLEGDFYMTTPERSIIDLVRVYPESEFLSQALLRIDDLTKVRAMADKYGVRDRLEEEIDYARNMYRDA